MNEKWLKQLKSREHDDLEVPLNQEHGLTPKKWQVIKNSGHWWDLLPGFNQCVIEWSSLTDAQKQILFRIDRCCDVKLFRPSVAALMSAANDDESGNNDDDDDDDNNDNNGNNDNNVETTRIKSTSSDENRSWFKKLSLLIKRKLFLITTDARNFFSERSRIWRRAIRSIGVTTTNHLSSCSLFSPSHCFGPEKTCG